MRLKKNIIANYFGQFYTIIIGIVMVPFYLKYLGTEAYGLVGFFTLIQSWMVLLDLGFSPTLSREVAKLKSHCSDIEKRKFISLLHSLELIFLIISVVLTISIIFFSHWIAQIWLHVDSLNLENVSYCISLMGMVIGLRFLSTLYYSGIAGAEAQVWLNVTNIVLNTLRYVGVLAILHFIDNDIKLFFEYQVIVAILTLVIFILKMYKLLDIGKFRIYFDLYAVKPILPFALSIAYTGGIWVFLTQLDKLLLSNILPLKEYGSFAIMALVANAILQLIGPIGQALQPRMVSLLHQNKENEMILLYRKATQFMAVFIFSVAGVVGVYSYELLYSWTGNIEISLWAKDILFWYVMGNAILAIGTFQYALQFAHGNLKMHVQYNTIVVIISVPLIYFAAYNHGALGVAILWFGLRVVSFFVWTPIVHHKFAKGIHVKWMLQDVLPVFFSSFIYLLLINQLGLTYDENRLEMFLRLILIGFGLLIVNSFAANEVRKIIFNLLKSRIK
ncbi:MAG: oligosaccharide flippase family protein [Sulfuricurvum sp.]|nr:oligosaccharide flippase family protein [Sulfuricurvum sp.]